MLKITQHRDPASKSISCILEGRLGGPWVDELDICWRRMRSNLPSGSMVDLPAVTFVDEKGKALLTPLWEGGAEFRAAGCLTICLVEEITKAGRTDSFRPSLLSVMDLVDLDPKQIESPFPQCRGSIHHA